MVASAEEPSAGNGAQRINDVLERKKAERQASHNSANARYVDMSHVKLEDTLEARLLLEGSQRLPARCAPTKVSIKPSVQNPAKVLAPKVVPAPKVAPKKFPVFKEGQRIQKRAEGQKEWTYGYVVSVNPLKVTVYDDPNHRAIARYHQVRPILAESSSGALAKAAPKNQAPNVTSKRESWTPENPQDPEIPENPENPQDRADPKARPRPRTCLGRLQAAACLQRVGTPAKSPAKSSDKAPAKSSAKSPAVTAAKSPAAVAAKSPAAVAAVRAKSPAIGLRPTATLPTPAPVPIVPQLQTTTKARPPVKQENKALFPILLYYSYDQVFRKSGLQKVRSLESQVFRKSIR